VAGKSPNLTFGPFRLAEFVGLRDYPGALAQFHDIQGRIDADGVGMDSTICPHFYSNFC
jgi:hypothetical protein